MNTIESLAAELEEKNLIIKSLIEELSSARRAIARAEQRQERDTELLAGCVALLDLPASRIAELAEIARVAA